LPPSRPEGTGGIDPDVKLQHWRGVSGCFGLQAAPVLEFAFQIPVKRAR